MRLNPTSGYNFCGKKIRFRLFFSKAQTSLLVTEAEIIMDKARYYKAIVTTRVQSSDREVGVRNGEVHGCS